MQPRAINKIWIRDEEKFFTKSNSDFSSQLSWKKFSPAGNHSAYSHNSFGPGSHLFSDLFGGGHFMRLHLDCQSTRTTFA